MAAGGFEGGSVGFEFYGSVDEGEGGAAEGFVFAEDQGQIAPKLGVGHRNGGEHAGANVLLHVGAGDEAYAYTSSGNSPGYDSWAMKTVETLPDGNQNIVYTNAFVQVMLLVYHDVTSNQNWETFYQYDTSGRVALEAAPSAVTGYEKPHPEAFRLVLRRFGEPRERWMVGDNPHADVAGAQALGIPAVLVRTEADAPLRAADDAFQLDTSELDAEAAFRSALAFVRGRIDRF